MALCEKWPISRIDRILVVRRFNVAGHSGLRGTGTRLDLASATTDVPQMHGSEDPMNDLHDGRIVSLELVAIVPQTVAESETLSASIEKAVQQQTSGGIANLAVVVDDGGVVLHGSCSSYYHKQLAQHAAMAVPNGLALTNCIEVD
jgi:BON domain